MRSASRLRALLGVPLRESTEGDTRSRERPSAPLLGGAWALLAVFHCGALDASETITYQYDALGRLTSTSRSGGTQTVYSIDAAGNRTQVQTSADGGGLKALEGLHVRAEVRVHQKLRGLAGASGHTPLDDEHRDAVPDGGRQQYADL
jgi:YD repeat-containing protein